MAKKQENRELGFGAKVSSKESRIINPDGTFNVLRVGQSKLNSISIYHALVLMSWRKFNFIVLLYFFLINLLFACCYYIAGAEGLKGAQGITPWEQFADAFFFSAQTLSTVGYGGISPGSFVINVIAAIESVIGLLGFALATGLLYGRFSRPKAHILFSKNAIIAPFKDKTAFQFRIINKMRNSNLSDMEARVNIAMFQNENGTRIRRYKTMELEVNRINFFPLVWNINHPITEDSPLYGMSAKDFKESQAEFLITIIGFDDTFSQTVHRRYSYTYHDIVCGAKWVSIYSENEKGEIIQDTNKLSEYELV